MEIESGYEVDVTKEANSYMITAENDEDGMVLDLTREEAIALHARLGLLIYAG